MLAVVGSLDELVSAASLTFLFTFATVNYAAFRQLESRWWRGIFLAGAAAAVAAALVLVWRLAVTTPLSLGLLVALVLATILLRPLLSSGIFPKAGKIPS